MLKLNQDIKEMEMYGLQDEWETEDDRRFRKIMEKSEKMIGSKYYCYVENDGRKETHIIFDPSRY